jgi:hypothetical protein
MKRRPQESPPVARGVLPGEIMNWAELGRRLNWGDRQLADAAKLGLRAVVVGRQKLVRAEWLGEFLEKLAAEQEAGGPA